MNLGEVRFRNKRPQNGTLDTGILAIWGQSVLPVRTANLAAET